MTAPNGTAPTPTSRCLASLRRSSRARVGPRKQSHNPILNGHRGADSVESPNSTINPAGAAAGQRHASGLPPAELDTWTAP